MLVALNICDVRGERKAREAWSLPYWYCIDSLTIMSPSKRNHEQ